MKQQKREPEIVDAEIVSEEKAPRRRAGRRAAVVTPAAPAPVAGQPPAATLPQSAHHPPAWAADLPVEQQQAVASIQRLAEEVQKNPLQAAIGFGLGLLLKPKTKRR
jgi:hypothetical protein